MRSSRPELIKQMTDVLDEMIPAIPVDDRTSALVARVGECILKAAVKEQASYETPLAAVSAEMGDLEGRERACLLTNRRWSGQGRYKSVTTITRSHT
jgi:hypothetical protein